MFVSSVVAETDAARKVAVRTIRQLSVVDPWIFEYTPASSERVDATYLRKVREAAFVLWIVGTATTDPVRDEIREAIASHRRLLVFRLPRQSRDPETLRLLAEVGTAVKRADLLDEAELPRQVQLALWDEITRALQDQPGMGRVALLEELGRQSRARCVDGWIAAGLQRAQALEWAADALVGAPPPECQPTDDRPVLVLAGEIGIGKSLAVERLFQGAVRRSFEDPSTPIPVFVDARELTGPLRLAVATASDGLGNYRQQGAFVCIDGIDELGSGQAENLVREAGVLADSIPLTAVVLASRPLLFLDQREEVLPMHALTDDEAFALVGRAAGYPIMQDLSWKLPDSVQDAIRRPLFAILLGSYLRVRDGRPILSVAGLIANLVERAVPHNDEAISALCSLAAESTERAGGLLPVSDVTAIESLHEARESGLLVERSGALGFPLPILTQWFAAQSLASGSPRSQELVEEPQRLELWRYPLVIAVGTQSHETVSALLTPVVERDPGFAAQVVTEAITRWAEDGAETSVPPWNECGRRIRLAMESWSAGAGPLARLVAPMNSEGHLLPLGAAVSRETGFLYTAWYFGSQEKAEVSSLEAEGDMLRNPDWRGFRFARPPGQSAWAWRWTLDEIIADLALLVHHMALPLPPGSLLREARWRAGLTLLGLGDLHAAPIPLAQIEERLATLAPDAVLLIGRDKVFEASELQAAVDEARAGGADALDPPWPVPDQDLRGRGWVWAPYSDEQTLERARVVYAGAFEGYQQLVTTWFPRLAPRLPHWLMLPAKIRGVIIPGRLPGSGLGDAPSISWYMEPFEAVSEDDRRVELDFRLGDVDVSHERLGSLQQQLVKLRPAVTSRVSAWMVHSILDIFDSSPITKLAYKWLWQDLGRTDWIKGGPPS